MKIIQDNYKANKFPFEVVCKNCNSILQIENSNDIKVIPDTATLKQGKGYTCSACGKIMPINLD